MQESDGDDSLAGPARLGDVGVAPGLVWLTGHLVLSPPLFAPI